MIGESSSSSRSSVHFPQEEELAIVVCEIEDLVHISTEDKKKLWIPRSEYDFAKSSARVVAKESERYGHSKHLDNTYNSLDEDAQSSLNLWALHGSCRRGLERWANSAHGELRRRDQMVYFSNVLRVQTDLKLKDTGEETRVQKLQEVSHDLSQRSRRFAEMMAIADAEAAKWEFHSEGGAVNLSPRQALKQMKRAGSDLGVGASFRLAPRRADSGLAPNLQGIARPRGSLPPTRRSPTAQPRISIRTRPARVSRMA